MVGVSGVGGWRICGFLPEVSDEISDGCIFSLYIHLKLDVVRLMCRSHRTVFCHQGALVQGVFAQGRFDQRLVLVAEQYLVARQRIRSRLAGKVAWSNDLGHLFRVETDVNKAVWLNVWLQYRPWPQGVP